MKTNYFAPPKPRLFGHRGHAAEFPENTLPAFAAALAAGTPYLELDVRMAKDGTVMVVHDASLLRTCGVDRAVSDLDLNEIRALDAGATFTTADGATRPHRGRGILVPTLAEVLTSFPEAFFNIEIKQASPAMEEATLEVVRQAGRCEQVLLAAEQDAVMSRLRPLCTALNIPTSYSFDELVAFFNWLQAGCRDPYRPPAEAMQIPETYEGQILVTPHTITAAHAVGVEIHVWTVNDADDMKRLLRLGVDGLMSDRPDLLHHTAAHLNLLP